MKGNTTLQGNKGQKKCSYKRENGTYCNSFAMKNSDYCYMHNPDVPAAEKKLAVSKGGKTRVLIPAEIRTDKFIKLDNPKKVTKFYEQLINEVMTGTMDLRLATGIGYLLNGLLKSLELSEMEQRISDIEQLIQSRFHNSDDL